MFTNICPPLRRLNTANHLLNNWPNTKACQVISQMSCQQNLVLLACVPIHFFHCVVIMIIPSIASLDHGVLSTPWNCAETSVNTVSNIFLLLSELKLQVDKLYQRRTILLVKWRVLPLNGLNNKLTL
jgi:hypothetical protein